MPLTVRLARIDDAPQTARVHVMSWQAAYRGLVPQEYLDGLNIEERTERWRSILSGDLAVSGSPEPAHFVAVQDDVVVGFANVGLFRDEPENPTAGELRAMYLDPAHWGTGVGDALMQPAFDQLAALGVSISYLWAFAANGRALRFYERHGWRSDDVTKPFEANGTELPLIRYFRKTPGPAETS